MPYVNIQDTRLYYEVYGKTSRSAGPPLLLIAGLGFASWCWFKQIPQLAPHYQIVVFDNRGSGNSDGSGHSYTAATLADDAAGLLTALGIQRAHVLGTSLGGFIAQELALRHPEQVAKLILCCTSFGGTRSIPMDRAALQAMMGWGALSTAQAIRRGLEVSTSSGYRDAHPDEFAQIINWRKSSPQSQVEYLKQVTAGTRFDAAGRVQAITVPTLILHGANDRVVPVKNAELLAHAIPKATLRIIDDAGHLVFIEQADEVNRAILKFLPRSQPPARPRIRQNGQAVTKKTTQRIRQNGQAVTKKTTQSLTQLKKWFNKWSRPLVNKLTGSRPRKRRRRRK